VTPDDEDLDPFDLPEWLGESPVTWQPDEGIGTGHLVHGTLRDGAGHTLACDFLAVDEAYPAPVADDRLRTRAHLGWRHGQVLLVGRAGRLTVAVPGRDFSAELVLESLARLARAVGADPDHYGALLRIGVQNTRSGWNAR
jgi:hypothetical protein